MPPYAAGPFAELALLLLACAGIGLLFQWLRQPMLIAYIAVGIIVGPAVLGLVRAHDQIDLLAQIGVAVLLFLVGLKLDLRQVRVVGPAALATGLGQLGFTITIGFLIVLALGRQWVEALYVAIALTFSSTIIIVKLLSDKRELDSLHGRIAVGFLIVQDIAVVVAMMAMSSLRDAGTDSLAGTLLALVWRVSAAALALGLLMRFVLPRLVEVMARSPELLLVFAIAWGTGLAALGEWGGFSKEAGAFLAGFSLASTRFREAISARLIGLRDFLLLFFFVDLGAKLELAALGEQLWTAALLSAFVLIGNPLIVMAIMGYMGYRRRTGFLAGLTVAQISEFSIVFVAMGIVLGHIGEPTLTLVTMVGIVTITASTYMILYSHPLYERLAGVLRVFERRTPHRELAVESPAGEAGQPRIVVFGLGRYGARLLGRLVERGVAAVGVDFDPEAVRELRRRGLPAEYGDGEDPAFVESLPLAGCRWAVITLPQAEAGQALLHALRAAGFAGRIVGVVRDELHGDVFAEDGVDRVFNPFTDAADHAAEWLAEDLADAGGGR